MTAADYRDQLIALLPTGRAWSRDPGSVLGRLLHGLADAFARIDARVDALVEEADPRTTDELLVDWERVAALPATGSIAARRAALASKLAQRGGQSRRYYREVAARIGFTVDIREFTSLDCADECGGELAGDAWRHAWRVEVTGGPAVADAELRRLLEDVIDRARPAHTTVSFLYPEP